MMTDWVRSLAATLARGPVARRVARAMERVAPWPQGSLAILTYHRVDDVAARPDLMPSLVSATPAAFADQMGALVEGYRPVSLADLVDALARPDRLPPRAVLVTFDDAYADFAATAWPVMQSLGIPTTLFVPTGVVSDSSHPFWWDRLWAACVSAPARTSLRTPIGPIEVGSPAACRGTVRTLRGRLKELDHDEAMARVDGIVRQLGAPVAGAPAVLDWQALRRLASEGVALAPHSRSHPLLDRIGFDRAVEEIAGSRLDLEREVGPVLPVLAYPSGAHGGRAVEAAREAGMAAAVTTVRGGNDLRRADPLRLRRINVGLRSHTVLIRAQVVWATAVDSRRDDRGRARDRTSLR